MQTISATHPSADRTAATRLTRALGVAATVVATGLASFNAALALGAPWAEYAWGGADTGQLPVVLRVASALAAIVLAAMAAVVLSSSGATRWPAHGRGLTAATWAVAGSMSVTTIVLVAFGSHAEEFLLSRATFVLAALSAVVAYRAGRTT